MPGVSSGCVFLSYRREDATPHALALQLQLGQRIPNAPVFMDLDSVEAGLDFAEVIAEALDSCAVLVALIGRQWATLADEEGRPRLDNPDDWVRFEVQTALERGVRVIPVLVDGAKALRQQQLPSEIQKLARLNAHRLSNEHYRYDTGQLLDLIQRVLAAPRQTEVRGETGEEAIRAYLRQTVQSGPPPGKRMVFNSGTGKFEVQEVGDTPNLLSAAFSFDRPAGCAARATASMKPAREDLAPQVLVWPTWCTTTQRGDQGPPEMSKTRVALLITQQRQRARRRTRRLDGMAGIRPHSASESLTGPNTCAKYSVPVRL